MYEEFLRGSLGKVVLWSVGKVFCDLENLGGKTMNRSRGKSQRKASKVSGKEAPRPSDQTSEKKSQRNGKSGGKFKDVTAKVDTGRGSEPPKVVETRKIEEPVAEPPVKMERANSFFLTRKISKIYNKLSGSRESLSGEEPAKPYQFTRSLSLSSIQLKKSYRRSQNESNLAKLHEDAILEHGEGSEEIAAAPANRQSVPAKIDPPKLERSNSILASFRRKISFRSDKKLKPPAKWNTSLQNLRQEDFMVSYDDLSFVDYDQFNQYEASLERRLSSSQFDLAPKRPVDQPLETTNAPVIKRRQKTDQDLRRKTLVRRSFEFENNLDQDKNLYRNSLDGEKLRQLSKLNRKSFRWSAHIERDVDALYLDSLDQLTVDSPDGGGLGHAKSAEGLLMSGSGGGDVCDSGMVDGEGLQGRVSGEGFGGDKRRSVSVGYVSRSQSLRRARSWSDAVEGSARDRILDKQVSSKSTSQVESRRPSSL